MATALTSEYTRFTDKCNKVLAGGIVKTFEPNSLTPKISYQDPNKEIPNLTEVRLDETGRAKIYIDGDYRIQVYSRDGVLIEDNLLVEQSLVQRDFTSLSQALELEQQEKLNQFQAQADEVIAQGFYKGFATETLLLAAKPTAAEMRARADDTRKIWRWNRTSAEGVVPVTGTWTDTGLSELDLAKYYADDNERLAINRNLFTASEIVGDDFSRLTTTTARSRISKVANGIQLSTPAATTTEWRFRFAAGQFTEAGVISAYMRVVSLETNAGSAAAAVKFGVLQTSAGGASLSNTSTTVAGAGSLSNTDAKVESVTLNPSAAFVEILISLQGATARKMVVSNLSLLPSVRANFVRPVARVNQWFDPQMTGEYANTNSGGVMSLDADGQQVFAMPSSATLQQIVYSLPASGFAAAGALLRFGAEVFSDNTTSNSASFVFYDASNVEISRSAGLPTVANVWDVISVEAFVPVNTARIDLRIIKDSATTVGKYRNIFLYSNKSGLAVAPRIAKTILHVDAVNGLDKNSGTRTSPLRTIQRAIDLGGQNTQIILAEGNYFEAPQLTYRIINLEVMAQRDSRVWLINNSKITGATKTSGQTKVWQMALASTPLGKHLYQWGTPDADSLILDSERSKCHQGRTHRLPDFTRLWQVASITAIDTATRPSWFWDSGTLYFSVVGGGSPTAIDVYYNTTLIAPFYGAGTQLNQTIKITGVTSFNWLHGFRTWDMLSATFKRCAAFGNSGNGFEFSDSVFVERIGCEAGGNSVDGAGAHQYRANPNNINSYYSGSDNWEHDNYDDGESLHERWQGFDVGGLIEYNGDRGIATAVGAHTKHIGTVARKNGQGTQTFGFSIDDGAGFACIGTAADGGVGTNMELVDCVSDSNVVNYNCAGHAANTLDAVNCKSFDATNIQYNASTGTINLIDCGYAGTGTVKNANGGGVINIKNTTTVT